MSDPYIGEIRMFSFDLVPKGWALCDGALLQIMQNQALYALLRTYFGGDGMTTFALPDLRGRVPVCFQPYGGYPMGYRAGEEKVSLTAAAMPKHVHMAMGLPGLADKNAPTEDCYYASIAGSKSLYVTPDAMVSKVPLIGATIGDTGGGEAHDNMQPSIVTNFCIAIAGLFPLRD